MFLAGGGGFRQESAWFCKKKSSTAIMKIKNSNLDLLIEMTILLYWEQKIEYFECNGEMKLDLRF